MGLFGCYVGGIRSFTNSNGNTAWRKQVNKMDTQEILKAPAFIQPCSIILRRISHTRTHTHKDKCVIFNAYFVEWMKWMYPMHIMVCDDDTKMKCICILYIKLLLFTAILLEKQGRKYLIRRGSDKTRRAQRQ